MNFYIHQDKARGRTLFLLVLLVIAFLFLFITVEGLLFVLYMDRLKDPAYPTLAIGVGVLMIAVVGGGSTVRTMQLSFGGGKAVAETMGGKLLQRGATRDPLERRLLNIVEEMALASGIPVPPVYLLDEDGINAFAAGYSPADAVIGVTRGSIELLSRDELQGVIAHEFSHIFNGDMKLNIRLMGLVFGLLVLSFLGQILVRIILESRSSGSSRSSNSNSGKDNTGAIIMVALLIGAALWILGLVGEGIARLIQAAISRQREYLADASAVQFTRNPDGIAGALKKIGGFANHGKLKAVGVSEVNHMLFACGLSAAASALSLDSHPPLDDRIRQIDPQWDGKYPRVSLDNPEQVDASEEAQEKAKNKGRDFLQKAAGYQILSEAATGAPSPNPTSEVQTALALDKQLAAAIRQKQDDLGIPNNALDAAAFVCVLCGLGRQAHVGALQAAIPAWEEKLKNLDGAQKSEILARVAGFIRHLSDPQKQALYAAIRDASPQVDLETACARQVVGLLLLSPAERAAAAKDVNPFEAAVHALAAVAHATGMQGEALRTAWRRAMTSLAKSAAPTGDPLALSPALSTSDLSALAACPEAMRKRFMAACSQLIAYDSQWTLAEKTLYNWLSAALDLQVSSDPASHAMLAL